MKCNRCNGTGYELKSYKIFYEKSKRVIAYTKFCRKCHSIGELDWIENITGKKKSINFENILEDKTTIMNTE